MTVMASGVRVGLRQSADHIVRRLAAATVVGAILGLLIGGVGGRLAMLLLAALNPEAAGVTSDDGFIMGRFTFSGTLSLLFVGTVIGILGGGIYFVLRGLMIGPRWFKILSISPSCIRLGLPLHYSSRFPEFMPHSLRCSPSAGSPRVGD